jgi:hypothetical protein
MRTGTGEAGLFIVGTWILSTLAQIKHLRDIASMNKPVSEMIN